MHLVGEDEALGAAGEVLLEEPDRQLVAVNGMEGVEDVLEGVLQGDRHELVLRGVSLVEGDAGLQELVGRVG